MEMLRDTIINYPRKTPSARVPLCTEWKFRFLGFLSLLCCFKTEGERRASQCVTMIPPRVLEKVASLRCVRIYLISRIYVLRPCPPLSVTILHEKSLPALALMRFSWSLFTHYARYRKGCESFLPALGLCVLCYGRKLTNFHSGGGDGEGAKLTIGRPQIKCRPHSSARSFRFVAHFAAHLLSFVRFAYDYDRRRREGKKWKTTSSQISVLSLLTLPR